jgi:hypothetical protein
VPFRNPGAIREAPLVAYDHQKPTPGPDIAAVEPRPARELVRLDVVRMLDSLHNRVAALAEPGMVEGDLLSSDPLEEHDPAAIRINNPGHHAFTTPPVSLPDTPDA